MPRVPRTDEGAEGGWARIAGSLRGVVGATIGVAASATSALGPPSDALAACTGVRTALGGEGSAGAEPVSVAGPGLVGAGAPMGVAARAATVGLAAVAAGVTGSTSVAEASADSRGEGVRVVCEVGLAVGRAPWSASACKRHASQGPVGVEQAHLQDSRTVV